MFDDLYFTDGGNRISFVFIVLLCFFSSRGNRRLRPSINRCRVAPAHGVWLLKTPIRQCRRCAQSLVDQVRDTQAATCKNEQAAASGDVSSVMQVHSTRNDDHQLRGPDGKRVNDISSSSSSW